MVDDGGDGRGYRASAKRRQAEISAARRRTQENAFRQRALLAAVPVAQVIENWKIDHGAVGTSEARIRLAASIWADRALATALNKWRTR